MCPLTLSPFIDPVLTTAGHVYERTAIQAHLERSATDPLTRAPLLNKSLTPVFVLRSRALEFRESVARACIARVCAGAPDPMRYLRRAVELIADTGSHVQVCLVGPGGGRWCGLLPRLLTCPANAVAI